jgi:hypothetical protein
MSVSRKEGAAYGVATVNGTYARCRFQVPKFQGTYHAHISDELKLLSEHTIRCRGKDLIICTQTQSSHIRSMSRKID